MTEERAMPTSTSTDAGLAETAGGGPVTYEAELGCEPHLAAALETYMRGRHIPQIFATSCFRAIHFECAGPGRLRTRYVAASRADLDRYLTQHTAAMRDDFLAHFPTGVTVSRAEWESVESWG